MNISKIYVINESNEYISIINCANEFLLIMIIDFEKHYENR